MKAPAGPQCPPWCVADFTTYEFDGEALVTHCRPIIAEEDLQANVEWCEDLRHPDDPEYFNEPPALVINGGEFELPITPATLDLLTRVVDAAKDLLQTGLDVAPPRRRATRHLTSVTQRSQPQQESHAAMLQRLSSPEAWGITPHLQAEIRAEMQRQEVTEPDVELNIGGVPPGWVAERLASDHLDVGSLMLLAIGLEVQAQSLVMAAEAAWRRAQE